MLLYVERWLKAPMQLEDGRLEPRTAGTPQGGVASPLLANLFLHYVFDRWMVRTHPYTRFERYADDIICHCRTKSEAVALLVQLEERLVACRLRLHPQKTKIVYCKDASNWHLPGRVVRLPWLHIPAKVGEMAQRGIRGGVPAGGEPHRVEGDPQGHSALGPSASQRQGPG